MTKPNDFVFLAEPKVIYLRREVPVDCDISFGLTKRELFSAMAMGAMVAGSQGLDITKAQFAKGSVELADALIAALNRDSK